MDRERIKDRIREIAQSPKHVLFDELETLLDNHVKNVVTNYNHHHGSGSHHAFTVGPKPVESFCIPNKRPFVLKVYVMHFLEAMESVGLYEP